MIVKDEAPVIDRCLASVIPFIDRWVVVDTGSADDTPHRVQACLCSIPGELHHQPWQNFAHNRNEALALARGAADYLFFIDADEHLELPAAFDRSGLAADGYHLECEYAGTTFARCALVASRHPWRWEGVVHEALHCGEPYSLDTLHGPRIVIAHDGARSRDPATYLKDAALLEEAVRTDPSHARNVFYLAQSYRDAGQWARSREWYLRRAAMGGWDEEVWYSLYQTAVLHERLGAPPDEVTAAYLRAFDARPSRAEPLVQLARYHRVRGAYPLALLFARSAARVPRPPDLLFVDVAAYAWRALDELSIAAFYAGDVDDGRAAADRLLAESLFPESERARIVANRGFYH